MSNCMYLHMDLAYLGITFRTYVYCPTDCTPFSSYSSSLLSFFLSFFLSLFLSFFLSLSLSLSLSISMSMSISLYLYHTRLQSLTASLMLLPNPHSSLSHLIIHVYILIPRAFCEIISPIWCQSVCLWRKVLRIGSLVFSNFLHEVKGS